MCLRLGLGRRASLPAHARTRTCPGSATAPGQIPSLAAGRSSLQDDNRLQTDVYSCIYCFHVGVAVPRRPKLCDQVSPSVPSAAPRRPSSTLSAGAGVPSRRRQQHLYPRLSLVLVRFESSVGPRQSMRAAGTFASAILSFPLFHGQDAFCSSY